MLRGPIRLTAALVAVLVPTILVPAAAVADPPPTPPPAWTTASFPVPTAPNGRVAAVACTPDGTYCVEVGSFHDPTGQQQPLAAHRTGTTWQRDTLPPVTTLGVELTAVSCASPSVCVAVGVTGNGLGDRDDRALAYAWNGTRWTRGALTVPDGSAVSRLSGVSCGSPTACIAVGETGSANGSRRSLSYSYDGRSWTERVVPVVSHPSSPAEGLRAVDCATATSCTAVGAGQDPAGIVLVWNGTTWSTRSPAPAPGAWIGELDGVSCSSPTTCTAVGYVYDGGPADLAVAQRLVSGHWVRDSLPSTIASLDDVSCPTSVCVATAVQQTDDKTSVGVARRTPAGTWSFSRVPTPDDDAGLTGVTCSAATACTVVGNGELPFVDRLQGTTWTPEPTVSPRGVFGSHLDGVSCPTATTCTAVGRYRTSHASLALVERWDGTRWTRQSVPDRAGQPFTALLDVACPTTAACVAVGQTATDPDAISVPEPYLASWTAASGWTSVPSPSPSGTDGTVNAVSCRSATSCVAVGSTYSGNGALTYVLRGSTWTARPVPLPSGVQFASLTGVSCAGPTTCHAVGAGVTGTGATQHVDLVWNGTAWSVGAAVGAVDAVSCVGAGASCTAVGTADDGDEHVAVFELRGGTWSPRTTPVPGGTKDPSHLAGVSCVAATCTAVGAGDAALVMRSVAGGAWTPEPAITPPGSGGLEDVWCVDAATCVSVGTFGPAGVIEMRIT